MRCSSCQRSAPDSPRSARSSSALKKPGPVAYSRTSPSPVWTRVEPAFSVATSGACRASTPISPAAPGTTIISASPSKAGPSGVTSETSKRRLGSFGLLLSLLGLLLAAAADALRLLDRLLDRPDHVEGLLGQLVVLAVEDLGEALDRVLELHVLARRAGELLGDEVRLRQEALDLARPLNDQLLLVCQLVEAEDGDDVLKVLVGLQDLLHARRGAVVVVRDDSRLQCAREGVERVDRGIDALLDDRARQNGGRVEVRERVRRRGVGEVVRRYVDRLHRRDRAGTRRGDPLLQLAHLRRERRLVADGARHSPEERRHLRARLDEAKDVVDEEEHLLALVAEVLRHRQPGKADAEARTRRFVHLAVDERDLLEHARLLHLEPEIVAFACALAHAGEDRDAAVLHRDVVNQLLDENRLADAGTA